MSQAVSDMGQTKCHSNIVCPVALGHALISALRAVASQPYHATEVEIIK